MKKFSDGDNVKVVDAPEHGKHLLGKLGVAKQPHGFGYEDDDEMVKFDGGGYGYFKEHQLEKAD